MQAAFFDLDKTVIAKASMVAFGGPLYREGLISRWLLLRALYGQLVYLYLGADDARLERMRSSVLALTRGWQRDHIQGIVREALEEVIEPIIYEEAVELMRQHQAAGRLVYLVSAAPEEIVAPLAEHLAVDAHIATRSAVDEHGRYCGELEFYAYGPNKAVAVRTEAEDRGIDLGRSYAYSDSATDIPMLECVGHPVAVNPDRELMRVARAREWDVRWFVRTVRLRRRMPTPAAAPAAAGGGAAAALTGVAVWWWLRREHEPAPPPPSRPERVIRLVSTWADVARRRIWAPAAAPAPPFRRRGPSWRPARRGRPGRG